MTGITSSFCIQFRNLHLLAQRKNVFLLGNTFGKGSRASRGDGKRKGVRFAFIGKHARKEARNGGIPRSDGIDDRSLGRRGVMNARLRHENGAVPRKRNVDRFAGKVGAREMPLCRLFWKSRFGFSSGERRGILKICLL